MSKKKRILTDKENALIFELAYIQSCRESEGKVAINSDELNASFKMFESEYRKCLGEIVWNY